uniref:Uncharacterized protein n=1 Tax=Arundo donax TaxID=35708 RepID=A0A0A9AB33_ARUDO
MEQQKIARMNSRLKQKDSRCQVEVLFLVAILIVANAKLLHSLHS